MKKVFAAGPAFGNASGGRAHVGATPWAIVVRCRGEGSISVSLDPAVSSMEVPCSSPGNTRNQFEDRVAHDLKITVSAPDTVEWVVLIEQ